MISLVMDWSTLCSKPSYAAPSSTFKPQPDINLPISLLGSTWVFHASAIAPPGFKTSVQAGRHAASSSDGFLVSELCARFVTLPCCTPYGRSPAIRSKKFFLKKALACAELPAINSKRLVFLAFASSLVLAMSNE